MTRSFLSMPYLDLLQLPKVKVDLPENVSMEEVQKQKSDWLNDLHVLLTTEQAVQLVLKMKRVLL